MASDAIAVPYETEVIETTPKTSTEPKGGWILFWFMLGLAVILDIIGVLVLLIDLAGLAISATVVGAAVGVPLDFFVQALSTALTWTIEFTFMIYFWYTGGKIALKLVITSIGLVAESIPLVDALPLATVTFLIAFMVDRATKRIDLGTLIKAGKFVAKFV